MSLRAQLHQALEVDTFDAFRPALGAGGRSSGGESASARVRLLKGLGASHRFAKGMSVGAGGGAAKEVGTGLFDTRQRVVVKAHVAKHRRSGFSGGGGNLRGHVRYLERDGRDGGERGEFYDRAEDGLDAKEHVGDWVDDRHHFRFIVSPENGDKLDSLTAYVRDTMDGVGLDLNEPNLDWIAINHYDTDQPHAHVLVRGARETGGALFIPKGYMAHGFRSRAQDVALEHLGPVGRDAAEERVRKQMTQDRWTRLDWTLERAADDHGLIPRGLTEDRGSAGALYRGRLIHLEGLDLAERSSEGWRIASDLKHHLDAIVLEQDILRQIHQRMEKTRATVRALEASDIAGHVVDRGEDGLLVVRDSQGQEHLLRAREDQTPQIGDAVSVAANGRAEGLVVSLGDPEQQLNANHLTLLDREIQHRFERAAGSRPDERDVVFDQDTEACLEARGRALVENGLARDTEFGVAPTPEGWRDLHDREVGLAVSEQLGVETYEIGEAFGARQGRFLGCVETTGGLFAIAERDTSGLIYGHVDQAPQIAIGAEVTLNSANNLVQEIGLDRGLGLEIDL
jgi:hypothetical protein